MAGDAPQGFNLFDAEDRLLAEAEGLGDRMGEVSTAARAQVDALIGGFRRAIREQRRLVKVSDRQQAQLAKLNQQLAQRTREAEDAVAKLKAAQASLVQAEKLASLGALVAGIAHEINTPVGIALSCASHLADSVADMRALYLKDDIGVEDFEKFIATQSEGATLVVTNCQRAADLIRSFKQVAVDRTSAERRSFDIGTVINETLVSLGPQIRSAGHRVVTEIPAGLTVDGHPGVISQIISNLVMNSITHAYDPGTTGTLTITLAQNESGRIRMVYKDDGKGIPPEHLGRIFDPFFTTRLGEGGSGLGLHIVYNLVTGSLGGTIAATSQPGAGAAFIADFPAVR